MSLQPVFQVPSTHYRLRPLQYDDAARLYALYHHSAVVPWLPSSFTEGGIGQTLAIMRDMMALYERGQGGFWAIVDGDDQLIGNCGLDAYDRFHKRYEIAFELHPEMQRKGIMTQALTVLIGYAFESLQCHRLDAYTLTTNEPSRRLLTKLGFQEEGVLREYRHFRGSFVDVVLLGLLRDQWA